MREREELAVEVPNLTIFIQYCYLSFLGRLFGKLREVHSSQCTHPEMNIPFLALSFSLLIYLIEIDTFSNLSNILCGQCSFSVLGKNLRDKVNNRKILIYLLQLHR